MSLDLSNSDHELLDEFLRCILRAHRCNEISENAAIGEVAEAFTFMEVARRAFAYFRLLT